MSELSDTFVNQSIARLRQIDTELRVADEQEEEALSQERGEGGPADLRRLATQATFQHIRFELLNERAEVAESLARAALAERREVADDDLAELAQSLDLGTVLRGQREGAQKSEECWTACTECVTRCGLSGECQVGCTECWVSVDGSSCPPGSVVQCIPLDTVTGA